MLVLCKVRLVAIHTVVPAAVKLNQTSAPKHYGVGNFYPRIQHARTVSTSLFTKHLNAVAVRPEQNRKEEEEKKKTGSSDSDMRLAHFSMLVRARNKSVAERIGGRPNSLRSPVTVTPF